MPLGHHYRPFMAVLLQSAAGRPGKHRSTHRQAEHRDHRCFFLLFLKGKAEYKVLYRAHADGGGNYVAFDIVIKNSVLHILSSAQQILYNSYHA